MSQATEILSYLKRGRSLTPLQALNKFGVFRLAARVGELRERGYPVQTTLIETAEGKRVAKYWMAV